MSAKSCIKRYIHIGEAEHLAGENENWFRGRKNLRLVLSIIARPILTVKHLEKKGLKRSKLALHIGRPPGIMKNESNGKGVIADEKNLPLLK